MLSAVKSRATSAQVVVGDKVYLTRRADNGKGQAGEAVIHGPRFIEEEAAGRAKDAPYLDEKVQERPISRQGGAGLDAGNGFAGGGSCRGQPHGRELQRRSVERLVHAGVSGIADLNYRQRQLQLHGQ